MERVNLAWTLSICILCAVSAEAADPQPISAQEA